METPIVLAAPPAFASATPLAVPADEAAGEPDGEAEAEEDESELEPHAASAASAASAAKIRAEPNKNVPPPRFMLRGAGRALRCPDRRKW